jgi:hypothetical protein
MAFLYMFEVKSIQTFLFQTGKLKYVISASERLDSLIDTTESSTLNHVLTTAGLSNDLLDTSLAFGSDESAIHFIRCKGGAFYAYCQIEQPLKTLRSAWTLLLSQLFPSLTYVDALVRGDTLPACLKQGHKQLAASRNTPLPSLPVSTAILARSKITGGAIVGYIQQNEPELDLDTYLHDRAYNNLSMRSNAALQDKFTPDHLKGQLKYPINLDDFDFKKNKDVALIHLDGNGVGLILQQLNIALENKSDADFVRAFRAFSDALSEATITAAKAGCEWVYETARFNHKHTAAVPLRPIVLGGDDVTLICNAELAFGFCEQFSKTFKTESRKQLKRALGQYLSDKNTVTELTASGGVLFHKASHPFTHSYRLVEGLCEKAKHETKRINQQENRHVSAIAYYRLSHAVYSDIEKLIELTQRMPITINSEQTALYTGLNYCLLGEPDHPFDISNFRKLLACSTNQHPISVAKWRQMLTHLAMNNMAEAERIYQRGWDINKSGEAAKALYLIITQFSGEAEAKVPNWYWLDSEKNVLQTFINDIQVFNKFDHQKVMDEEH